MAEGFICRRGGGGSNKSMIIVTAPAGSTVTATCGTTVKTAVEKNGQWTFKNCDIGTWTVKAVLDGLETSGSVVIKEDGQLMRYSLTLAFWTATIAVTYPAGSVCTCSNGNTVLTAPDTSGSYTFSVHNSGTWTVSAGDKSVQVAVSNEQEYSANLTELVLYDSGDECTSVTGGWKAVAMKDSNVYSAKAPTIKKNSRDMTISISGDHVAGIARPSNATDLTDFSKLNITGKSSYKDYAYLNVLKTSETDSNNDVAHVSLPTTSRTSSIDVSKLSGNYYVAVSVEDDDSTGTTATIEKVWLS